MTTLDQQVDDSLQELQRRRKTKLTLAIVAVVAACVGMFALTLAMYSSTPAEVSEERIGADSFM